MFPETDGISIIISDTMKVVFQRRLVDRVLRLWKEMAHREPFPRRDQIEPAMLGVDWLNCLVIAVKSPVRLSTFVVRWRKFVFYALPRRKPRRSSPFTFAAGSFGTPLPDDRGHHEASRSRYPISERSLPVI